MTAGGHPFDVVSDLDWDGCIAIRDVGGLATPSGLTASRVFIRGDNARNLTSIGWEQAWAYGIRTVLDLRSEAECVADDAIPAEITYRRVSLFAHFDEDAAYRADLLARLSDQAVASKYLALYGEAIDLDRAQIAKAFTVLATAPGAVLFHCVAGKDRTGVVTALLLRLVGVSMHEVETDYMRAQECARGRAAPPHLDEGAPTEVISQVLTTLEAQRGSVGSYLLDSGVSRADLAMIAERFLDNEPSP
jgi:protein-tyrosine phosphatase